ncbi:hypothetical protein MHUMG1_07748 [Metarhizium humberi]|uniref:Fungal transcriptional regulatory protein n=1 Tax=Metarhizium humberi TaxID=2596975 RepID=A0A9P8M5W8_9HYPO|nr:hypothetical protein MHUMG1_07748 [Metarhizium humberi]
MDETRRHDLRPGTSWTFTLDTSQCDAPIDDTKGLPVGVQPGLGLGLRCPGPRTGALFVHVQWGESSSESVPEHHPGTASALGPVTPRNAFVHTPLVSDPRSCRATAFDQLFVSHFVESFGQLSGVRFPISPNANWLERLPQYTSSPGNSLAKTAIRSASMLSYATWARDKSIQTEAYKWYARALAGLQAALSHPAPAATESNVCSAVMLIHFETWADTAEGAWLKHVHGASTLLEAAGPRACREGFMHRIFCHLRFQAFIATMYENRLSGFASPEWTGIPFEIHPPNVFDQIVTILFGIQACLATAHGVIQTRDLAANVEVQLRALAEATVAKLLQWEQQFMPPPTIQEMNGVCEDSWPSASSPSPPTRPSAAHDRFPPAHFTSMPEAALLSLYHAACIVACRLLAVARDDVADGDGLLVHTQEIIRAYKFVERVTDKAPTSNLGPVMMVPQLKMASLWGVDESQRVMAMRMLKRVGQHQSFALGDIGDLQDGYFASVASWAVALTDLVDCGRSCETVEN